MYPSGGEQLGESVWEEEVKTWKLSGRNYLLSITVKLAGNSGAVLSTV